jgi:hypothetical protein
MHYDRDFFPSKHYWKNLFFSFIFFDILEKHHLNNL